MSSNIKAIPEQYHNVTPYIVVQDAAKAIEFYKRALGAEERARMPSPDGKVMHAEIQVGDSIIMLSDEFPDMGGTCQSPLSLGGSSSSLLIYTENTDESFKRAVQAGAKATMEPQDMFWGDRYAKVIDPFGHQWQFATHTEDLTPEQMSERASQAFS